MDEETRTVLDSAADEVFDAAKRLIDIGEMLDEIIKGADEAEAEYGPGDAGCRRTEDRGKWLRGAKRELSMLLREIEGPNPPPAPRRRS